MNNFAQKFEKNLRLFYQATKIPICVFDNMQKDLLRSPRIASMDCSPQTMQKCSQLLKKKRNPYHLPIFISFGSCFLALLALDSHTNVMFGPMSSVPLTYREFFHSQKDTPDPDDLMHLYRVIQQGPHMDFSQFASNISLYIKLAFREEISAHEILANHISLQTNHAIPEAAAMQERNCITGTKAIQLENRILFHIKNGHINELKKIIQDMPFFSKRETFPSTAEDLQKEFFIYASLCSKTVIDEGLGLQKAFAILDTYISQISSLTTPKHYHSMYAQISLDYCQEMVELHRRHTDSPVVTQCIQYIQNHIYSRITIHDLAKHCHVSKRTITRHFSEYCHIPAGEYILQLKLKEAAFLLTNSAFSLVEISSQLSFSSQSHFSTAFKAKYNYTPQQYRDRFKTG